MQSFLEQLLGSVTRARLIKLFWRNPDDGFTFDEVITKVQSKPKEVKTELKKFEELKIVNLAKRKGDMVYIVNRNSPYFSIMETMIATMGTTAIDDLAKMVKNLGRVKLALATGIFLQYIYSKADLLIVGEDISSIKLNNFLKRVEAETGKEIDYVIMDTDEYHYRRDMFDRFILEMFEKPHVILIDKLSPRRSLESKQ